MKPLTAFALLACMALSAPVAQGHAPSPDIEFAAAADTAAEGLAQHALVSEGITLTSLKLVGCCDQGYEIKSMVEAASCCDQGYEIKSMSDTTLAMLLIVAAALLALAFNQFHYRNTTQRWTLDH